MDQTNAAVFLEQIGKSKNVWGIPKEFYNLLYIIKNSVYPQKINNENEDKMDFFERFFRGFFIFVRTKYCLKTYGI